MIIVKLKGGLGNQMLQYAYARSLSEKRQDKFFLDTTYLSGFIPGKKITNRDYELSNFNVQNNITKLSLLAKNLPRTPFPHLASCTLTYLKNVLGIQKYIKEKKGGFEKNTKQIREQDNNIYLNGYWHSDKYFSNIRKILVKEFTLKDDFGVEADFALSQILKYKNSVSMHVRQLDFLSNSYKYPCNISYYKKAIDFIKSKIENPKFFVFSNNIERVKQDFPLPNASFISNKKISISEDLILMSTCKHNIIANSSFSWWSAWLNQFKDKIVITPSPKKFNITNPEVNLKERVPENWTIIEGKV